MGMLCPQLLMRVLPPEAEAVAAGEAGAVGEVEGAGETGAWGRSASPSGAAEAASDEPASC